MYIISDIFYIRMVKNINTTLFGLYYIIMYSLSKKNNGYTVKKPFFRLYYIILLPPMMIKISYFP